MKKKYQLEFEEQFEIDIQRHIKSGQKKNVEKIARFIDELETHPSMGIGNPEPLKGNRVGQWSRELFQRSIVSFMRYRKVL